MRTCVLSPKGYQDPALEPVLGKGSVSERLVADPSSMGSSRAQPEKETWVCPHVGPPPAGGAVEVWCSGNQVAVQGGGLVGLITGY